MDDVIQNWKEKNFFLGESSSSSSPSFSSSSSSSAAASLFYGVNIFPEIETGSPLVFTEKSEALKSAREHKGARFKAFTKREDALSFAVSKCLTSTPLPGGKNNNSLAPNSPEAPLVVGVEKSSPFKAPRSQEMVKLRKMIECGDVESFRRRVWENPRYLISGGDTPSIMQEGFRYNALHVAAKTQQSASMCKIILETIQDEQFLRALFNDDSKQIIQRRKTFLVDLYLNMPDKGMNETPLHFASKFGCSKAVEILLSHPLCDRSRINKYGKMPFQVICERFPSLPLEREIHALYQARYFIPILRAEDNSVQPIIGRPFSLEDSAFNFSRSELSRTPQNPLLVVKAKVGPMPSAQANLFYKRWKTPSCLSNSEEKDARLSDSDKGLERIGRHLAKEFSVPWLEYWPFLSSWCNLSSPEGLEMLEKHLKGIYDRMMIFDENYSEDSLNYSLSREDSLSPISALCRQFEGFHLNSSKTSSISNGSGSTFSTPTSTCAAAGGGGGSSCSSCSSFSPYHPKRMRTIVKTLKFDSPEQQQHCQDSKRLNVESGKSVEMKLFSLANEIKESLGNLLIDIGTTSCWSSMEMASLSQLFLKGFWPAYQKMDFSLKSRFPLVFDNLHGNIAQEMGHNLSDNLSPEEIAKILNVCQSFFSFKEDQHHREKEEDTKNEKMLESDDDDDDDDDEDCLGDCSPMEERFSSIRSVIKIGRGEKNENYKMVAHLKCVLLKLTHFLSSPFSKYSALNCDCFFASKNTPKCADLPTKQTLTNRKSCNSFSSSSSSPNSNSSSSADDDIFVTPNSSRSSSPASLEFETPEQGIEIYIQGLNPSKVDLDVFYALQGIEIDPLLYPHTSLWKHLIHSFPNDVAKKWMSPFGKAGRGRGRTTMTSRSAPPRLTKRETSGSGGGGGGHFVSLKRLQPKWTLIKNNRRILSKNMDPDSTTPPPHLPPLHLLRNKNVFDSFSKDYFH